MNQMSSNTQEASMKRENASYVGRPQPEELVPSRYAVQIGEIEVLVISDGVLPLPTAMLGHNADPAARAAWLGDMFLPQDAFDWALNVVVVRSREQTILIDAGLGLDPDLNLPRAGQLMKRLAAAGIDLASVTDVVLTHMHMDHVGGLLVDGVKEQLNPDLRIHVAAAEVKFWESPDFTHAVMPEGSRTRFGRPPSGSSKIIRATCGCSRMSVRWRRAWSCLVPAGIPRTQRGPRGIGQRPSDVCRRRRVRGRIRPPRLAQRFRTRPRGGSSRPRPAFAGAGGDR